MTIISLIDGPGEQLFTTAAPAINNSRYGCRDVSGPENQWSRVHLTNGVYAIIDPAETNSGQAIGFANTEPPFEPNADPHLQALI